MSLKAQYQVKKTSQEAQIELKTSKVKMRPAKSETIGKEEGEEERRGRV
jgi:hypothetical protein